MMVGEPASVVKPFRRVAVSFSVCVKLFVNREFVCGPVCTHDTHCQEELSPVVYMDDSVATRVSPVPLIMEDRRMTGIYELGFCSEQNTFAPKLQIPLLLSQPRIMAYTCDSFGRDGIVGYKVREPLIRQLGVVTNMMLRSGIYDLRFSDKLRHCNINTENSPIAVTKVITLSRGVKTLFGFQLFPRQHYLFVLDSEVGELQVEHSEDDLFD